MPVKMAVTMPAKKMWVPRFKTVTYQKMVKNRIKRFTNAEN